VQPDLGPSKAHISISSTLEVGGTKGGGEGHRLLQ
jgi:hypothetical protein